MESPARLGLASQNAGCGAETRGSRKEEGALLNAPVRIVRDRWGM